MLDRLKSLTSDTAIYGGFTIIGRFLTFLLTPIYTTYIPNKEELGDIIYIYSMIAFLNILYTFGMDSAYLRFFKKGDINNNREAFTNSYLFILMASGLFSLLIISFSSQIAPSVSNLPNAVTLVIISAIIPFLDTMMVIPYAYLRMSRQAFKFAFTRLLLIIISVTANFILVVLLRWGAEGVLYSQLIANIIGAGLFIGLIVHSVSLKFNFRLFVEMVKFGLPTLPASLSAMILQVADRPILKALTDSTQVALYGVNYRLGIPMMLFVTVFEYAWKPFYLSHYEEEDSNKIFSKVLTYFTFISIIIFLAVSFFMDYIVRMPFIGGSFIHPNYWQGMSVIPLILIGYYFNGVFNNFALGINISKKTKYLPIAVGISAAINLILNFILIPIIGYMGAAWATFGAYLSSAAILYYFSRKVYPIDYEWKRIALLVVLCIAVFSIHIAIGAEPNLTGFLIELGLIATFVVLTFVLKFYSVEEIRSLRRIFKLK